jgi:hypothetical protein
MRRAGLTLPPDAAPGSSKIRYSSICRRIADHPINRIGELLPPDEPPGTAWPPFDRSTGVDMRAH